MGVKRKFCTFYVGGYCFGLPALRVQEILFHGEITAVPLAPPTVAGLLNLRGDIVTAILVRRRLQLADSDRGPSPVSVVVRTDDGAVSFLVDEVGDVLNVDDSVFESVPPTLGRPARDMVLGAYKLEDRLVLLLDAERVCDIDRPGSVRAAGLEQEEAADEAA